MGAFCCCPCPDDYEEYGHPTNPIYRHCLCLRYFFRQLFSGYGASFQRLESRSTSLSTQSVTPLTPTAVGTSSADNSMSETFHLVPRPPPYETDPRYTSQREGLVSRREKSTSHIHEDSQAVRRSGSSSAIDSITTSKKRSIAEAEEGDKLVHSESFKNLSMKVYSTGYAVTSTEDEDVCPTCLEEYSAENPKIVAKCSHHFHLSCIYEWMERSDTCPVCGKEMEFCEDP